MWTARWLLETKTAGKMFRAAEATSAAGLETVADNAWILETPREIGAFLLASKSQIRIVRAKISAFRSDARTVLS